MASVPDVAGKKGAAPAAAHGDLGAAGADGSRPTDADVPHTDCADAANADVLVRLSHVTLVYGSDAPALDDVSLELRRGERVCVIGANGSGKSTLASVVAGLLAPDAGTVELAGERVCEGGAPDLEAYRRARRSLGLVFQNPDDQIVTSVVEDDVAFGPENLGLPPAQIRERVDRELQRVALGAYAKADPSRLSGGQRQRVCIAGALALEPQVLVLDEPASLLDVRGREAILRVMGRLAKAGTTLLHVTHLMDEALQADRVIVLDHGHVALEGTPGEVFSAGAGTLGALGLEMPFAARLSARLGLPLTCSEDALADELAARYQGVGSPGPVPTDPTNPAGSVGTGPGDPKDPDGAEKSTDASGAAVVARASHVSFSYGPGTRALADVSLELRAGTSCAIVGQTGSGKSTLLRLLCGLAVPDEGTVEVCGHGTARKRDRRLARRSVGYVMQHPERQLFAETVWADVAFGPTNLRLPADEVERRVSRALALVGLEGRSDASPFELSGGQRRLCAIAGVLAMDPTLLVLDEPTAGLDPAGRDRVRAILDDLRTQGIALVQVTHSMEDAARADHVVVLDGGSVLVEGTPDEVFSAANEGLLRASGLGVPQPLAFAERLAARGLDVGRPLTTDALVAALGGGADPTGPDAATEPAADPYAPAPAGREGVSRGL